MKSSLFEWVKNYGLYTFLAAFMLVLMVMLSNYSMTQRHGSQRNLASHLDKFSDTSPQSTPAPQPTVLSSTPTPTPPTANLVSCTVFGETHLVTVSDCELGKSIERQSKEYDSLQRQKQAEYKPLTLDYVVAPPPTIIPTTAQCNTQLKAQYKAEYDSLVAAENQEYSQLQAYIRDGGGFDNSGSQMIAYTNAKNVHEKELAGYKAEYESRLKSINCY